MARKYDPAKSTSIVTDRLLAEARERAAAASARLYDAEHADPSSPGWDVTYEAAATAVRATSRRVEGLERLRAAQIERGGKREAAAKAAAPDLKSMAAQLGASRDGVAAAAVAHLKALAGLAVATETHNALVAEHRAHLAALGLRVRDDLLAEGEEHDEGCLDTAGLRTAPCEDWTPVAGQGVVCHGLRLVFGEFPDGSVLASAGKYTFRAHDMPVRLPSLADAGAAPRPVRASAMVPRLSIRDLMEPAAAAQTGGYYTSSGRKVSA